MIKVFLTMMMFLSVFSTASIAADGFDERAPIKKYVSKCNMLGDHLYDCTEFSCVTSSKNLGRATITHKIIGLDDKNRCVHEQNVRNIETITCKYKEESRKFISLNIKSKKEEVIKDEQSDFEKQNIMRDIFENECEIAKIEKIK